MTSISILESKLQRAFQVGLHLPPDIEFNHLEFAKSEHWDSIAHLELIASIEDEFKISIETTDVLAMNSYLKSIEIVKKYATPA